MALSRVYTGADAPSGRQPGARQAALLKDRAHRIKYLCLHGFLAVDGVEYVIRQMQEMAADCDCFILDMHQVSGVSTSAARLLNHVRTGFAEDGIAVVFSRIHGRQAIIEPLSKSGPGVSRGFLSFEDNDLAVEWCENRLIGEDDGMSDRGGALADVSLFAGLPGALLSQIEEVTRLQAFRAGERILEGGQAGDGRIFFVQAGRVSILVPLRNGSHQRIASMGPGGNFGEMVLLGQTNRSASVYAETDVACRVLDANDFDRLSQCHPVLRITLLENLAKDMAQKLRRSTQWISALA